MHSAIVKTDRAQLGLTLLACSFQIARFEDAASIAQSALEDEREKRRAVSRDLEDFRKARRKLESDIAMFEIRAAEQRLLLESKDDHLRKCEEEIRHLVKLPLQLIASLRTNGLMVFVQINAEQRSRQAGETAGVDSSA